jgi:hypothetical protein
MKRKRIKPSYELHILIMLLLLLKKEMVSFDCHTLRAIHNSNLEGCVGT